MAQESVILKRIIELVGQSALEAAHFGEIAGLAGHEGDPKSAWRPRICSLFRSFTHQRVFLTQVKMDNG